jgi:IclR family acetate operon transcriptional repressor
MNQSVRKAFEILSFIVENPGTLGLNQMARALDINKTTLFRFLNTLESLEILTRQGDRYVPGIKLFEWGSKVPVKQLLVDKVRPLLRKLTAEVNETVNLAEFSNNQVLYLDKTESQRSLQIKTGIGSYTSLHCTALGKSILSILPETLVDDSIRRLNFVKKTSHTITNPETLRKQVNRVGVDGYGTDYEELEEGLHCVAVPLLIESMNFYGSISCSGPSVRFTPQRMEELARQLKLTADEIKKLFSTGDQP